MSDADAVRADVWLWRTRLFKTRALAASFIEDGRVRLNRRGSETRLDKPSRTVKPGDAVVFALAGRVRELTVLDIGTRRGPAPEARALYAEAVDNRGTATP